MLEKQSISITGATGFVGVNLKKYLSNAYSIIPISVRFIPNQQLNIKGNATIHLAGKAHDLKKTSNPQEYYEANFELTKQLFDAFLSSNCVLLTTTSCLKAIKYFIKSFKFKSLGLPSTSAILLTP